MVKPPDSIALNEAYIMASTAPSILIIPTDSVRDLLAYIRELEAELQATKKGPSPHGLGRKLRQY